MSLLLFAVSASAEEIHCPGAYDGHLQGIAVDVEGNIYWSFTVSLVKTDAAGALLQQVSVPHHHGDVWVADGTVYAAMNHRAAKAGARGRESFLYAYRAADLSLLWKRETPEVAHGAGALAMCEGHFFVASGRCMTGGAENHVYEYDAECVFIQRHALKSGPTYLGIQAIAYAGGTWWFGCYGNPPETIRANKDFSKVHKFGFDCSVGIAPVPGGGFYIGHSKQNEEGKYVGWVSKTSGAPDGTPASHAFQSGTRDEG